MKSELIMYLELNRMFRCFQIGLIRNNMITVFTVHAIAVLPIGIVLHWLIDKIVLMTINIENMNVCLNFGIF